MMTWNKQLVKILFIFIMTQSIQVFSADPGPETFVVVENTSTHALKFDCRSSLFRDPTTMILYPHTRDELPISLQQLLGCSYRGHGSIKAWLSCSHEISIPDLQERARALKPMQNVRIVIASVIPQQDEDVDNYSLLVAAAAFVAPALAPFKHTIDNEQQLPTVIDIENPLMMLPGVKKRRTDGEDALPRHYLSLPENASAESINARAEYLKKKWDPQKFQDGARERAATISGAVASAASLLLAGQK